MQHGVDESEVDTFAFDGDVDERHRWADVGDVDVAARHKAGSVPRDRRLNPLRKRVVGARRQRDDRSVAPPHRKRTVGPVAAQHENGPAAHRTQSAS